MACIGLNENYAMFARYNAWANQRLYDSAARLSDADYRADKGAFFKSMHGTLSHILVGDRVWMHRFTGEGQAPSRLDEIPFEDFVELRRAREAEDAHILAYVDGLSDDDLQGTLTYRLITNPVEIRQPLAPALSHFFNHQTHHRGQAHCLLKILTGDAPALDLTYYQREIAAT